MEQDAWDSDEDISNQTFSQDEEIDINLDWNLYWSSGKITWTLDEMVEIHWVSYQGEENKWLGLNQYHIKLAPHMKMQGRYDIREIHRIKNELDQQYQEKAQKGATNYQAQKQSDSDEDYNEHDENDA